MQQRFSGAWSSRYPPLHYGFMALAYAPVRLLSPPAVVSHESKTYERLFIAGRLLSLAMALGTLLLLYCCGVETVGARAAPFAALCLALSPTFTYYAKFANLDVPYVFWFTLSLLLLLRFLRTRATPDALGWAAASALSVGTKDQAYALYLLLPLVIVWAVRKARRSENREVSLPATLRDERIVLPFLVALVLFVSAHNLLFNATGFFDHVALITGDASRDYRMFEKSAAGQWRLLGLAARLVVFVLGEPVALLALVGLLIAWRGKERRLLSTLVPIVSSHVFFLAVVLYAYDRFVLPHAVVLSLFAARAFAATEAWGRLGMRLRWLATGGVLAFGIVRCVSLDLLLESDARYTAERWLASNVRHDARIAVLGPLEYLPRLHGFNWKQRTELLRAIDGMDPEYVVVNADYAARAEDPRARELYTKLESGEAGYESALAVRTRLDWPFQLDEYVRRRGDALPTNLDKINPEIRVYRRRDR